MNDAREEFSPPGRGERIINSVAVAAAYIGGLVVLVVGLTSFVSIIGRTVLGRPIAGDFELVEIGIAIAGSLFLPYCQLVRGHVVVDLFLIKASPRVIDWVDRFGNLLMAITLLVIGWRTAVAAYGIWLSRETSMLLEFPLWIGYASVVPGTIIAGLIAFAQCGFSRRSEIAEFQYE